MSASSSRAAALAGAHERIRRALGMSRPLPRVAAQLRTPVPTWALRAGQLLVALACIALGPANGLSWLVAVPLAVLMVVVPRPYWAAMLALWAGVVVGFGFPEPFPPNSFALLFGVHLLVVLGAALDRIPLSARVELGVLAAPSRRFLVVQAFSQALALLAAWVTARDMSAAWVTVAAGALVAAVLWVIVARLSRAAADEADA